MLDPGCSHIVSPRRSRAVDRWTRILVLVALLAPGASDALTIKSVSVTVHPVKDDAACPGGCKGNCTCGCAPGDPAGCGSNECGHPQPKICCTPERIASDPACFTTASGCCGNMGNLPANFCGGPGGPSVCPDAECDDDAFY